MTLSTIYQIPVGYKSNSVLTTGLPYEVQKFAQSFVYQTYEDMYTYDSSVVIMLDLDTSGRSSSPSLAFISTFFFFFLFAYFVVVIFVILFYLYPHIK